MKGFSMPDLQAETAPDAPTPPESGLGITDSAARRIAFLAESEGKPGLMLRITISGGGCSGFQYSFDLDMETGEEDVTFEKNGTRVVVDTTSLGLLNGSVLDYKEDMIGAYFVIENPNANSTCGCGSSFSV